MGLERDSLDRHLRDKQELLEAIADLALAEIPAIAQDRRRWRMRLEVESSIRRDTPADSPCGISAR